MNKQILLISTIRAVMLTRDAMSNNMTLDAQGRRWKREMTDPEDQVRPLIQRNTPAYSPDSLFLKMNTS
jgi:hypothetical protein